MTLLNSAGKNAIARPRSISSLSSRHVFTSGRSIFLDYRELYENFNANTRTRTIPMPRQFEENPVAHNPNGASNSRGFNREDAFEN